MFKTKRRIFISYRRSDSRDVVGRIYDRLIQAFGRKNVFKDIDSIPIASEFREVIVQYLANCDAVIVVIGRAWASAVNDEGRVRLHEPLDYVRIEIEQALSHKVPVVPTLIGDATLPQESELPESIREIRRKQVTTVRHDPDFHVDMDRLIRGLKALPPRNPPLNAAAVFHPSPKSSRLPKEPPGFETVSFLLIAFCLLATPLIGWLIGLGYICGWVFICPFVYMLQVLFSFSAGVSNPREKLQLKRWVPAMLFDTALKFILFMGLMSSIHMIYYNAVMTRSTSQGTQEEIQEAIVRHERELEQLDEWERPLTPYAFVAFFAGLGFVGIRTFKAPRFLFFERTMRYLVICCVAEILGSMATLLFNTSRSEPVARLAVSVGLLVLVTTLIPHAFYRRMLQRDLVKEGLSGIPLE